MPDAVSPVIPFLHYADLDATAKWLPRVFGIPLTSLDRDPSGTPVMAVFQHGNGLIFARQDPRPRLQHPRTCRVIPGPSPRPAPPRDSGPGPAWSRDGQVTGWNRRRPSWWCNAPPAERKHPS
jgi:hypothetical protein